MATLAELVKGFRTNVREGNPCEMRFNGQEIHLYPLSERSPLANRTFVGICTKPTTMPKRYAVEIAFNHRHQVSRVIGCDEIGKDGLPIRK